MKARRGRRPVRRSLRRRIRRTCLRQVCKVKNCLGLVVSYVVMLVLGLVAWYEQCYPAEVVEKHWTRANAKPLPQNTRPCLPDVSSLVNDWAPLSQDDVVKQVVEALKAWSLQVFVPTQLACELTGLLGVHACMTAVERADNLDACVLRCVTVAIVACDDVCLAKRLSHQLGLVTRAMVAWAFVPDLKTKKLTSLHFDHLLHMIGSIRMFLHTRWQALAGRRRRSWAIHRLQCVHPDLQVALFDPGPLSPVNQRACANFLAVQLRCQISSMNEEGHLYLLCSLRQCYLGSTACNRRAWRCTMRSPMSRFYEHLHDLKLARRSASYAKFLRKTRIFKHVDLGDLCIWVVAVEQLAVVRSPACKPMRRSQASRQSGRRPPPRFRLRPDRSQLEHRVTRARGLKACDRWLRQHNLPGTKKKKIRWPIAVPTRVFRSCLQDIRVSLVQKCGPLLSRWIVPSVQVVAPPRKTYTRCWNHIQACRDLPDACCFANVSHDLTDHWTYVEQLRVPPGFVAVQEDKDKASCWLLPCAVYNKLFALMVRQDAEHWVRHSGNVVDIVEHYRQLHEDKLPSHLRLYCACSRWKRWRLSYMYINIKSKCFESGVGRVCLKPSHACCRRIVSWATHPCKWLYKLNARALEGAVRLWGKGFETHDLFSAVHDLRLAVDKLNHSHGFVHCCYKCHSPKQPLCVWVGDAAQLFEEVCRDEVLTRLKAILAELCETSDAAYGIVTKKSRRLHYWLARKNFRPSAAARLHRWDEMVAIAEVALAQTCVRVGPVLFQQCRGVPIGGFLSKQCASIYLVFSEAQWVQNAKEEHGLRYPPQLSFCEAVAATRYVDDLVLVSSVLCGACLNNLPGSIYQQPVSFDAAKPAQLGVPWLDVWLRCDGLNLDVLAHGIEGPWRTAAAGGDVGPPTKFRLMPFQGVAMLDEPMLLALLNGKLDRWRSLDLLHVNLLRVVGCELQIWALHGYPLGVMLRIWRRGRHCRAAVRHARIILQKAIAKHGEQACVPLSPSN